MKTHVDSCDERHLQVLLTGDEDSAEFVTAASHVESCHPCQERLSDLAAAADEWHETRELLHMSQDEAGFANECSGYSWSRLDRDPSAKSLAGTAHWTESMVRPFLGPPSHPEMLGRLGRYEIERLIGSGGMGIVLKGFDTELNRPVAIKMLAPHLAGNGAARQRFAREARAAAAVVHEHVVAIHNVESGGSAPFLVMKFVAGESLQGRIDRQGPLELCEILRIAHQTAAGLAAAHAQGLVHRDVKPANILLEQGVERALLTDFGLARASDDASLTHTGYLPGTPHYMSPEQARGESADARSDLFSLGSVIYTMCTGRPPFRAETGLGILRRITDSEPRAIRELNPAIPDWLAAIVARLLAKSPTQRFASAEQVAALLEACLAHVQQPTVVPLPEECRLPTRIGKRTVIAVISVALVVLAMLTVAVLSGLNGDQRPSATGSANPGEGPSFPGIQPNATAADPAVDWESVDQEIRGLVEENRPFESRARRLWDLLPLSIVNSEFVETSDEISVNPNLPGTSEDPQ